MKSYIIQVFAVVTGGTTRGGGGRDTRRLGHCSAAQCFGGGCRAVVGEGRGSVKGRGRVTGRRMRMRKRILGFIF